MNNIFTQESVSAQEWADYIAATEAADAKDWADFLERQQNYDDALQPSNRERKNGRYLAQNEGVDTFYFLGDLDGNILPARMVDGKFGKVWCVTESEEYGSPVVAWVTVSSASTVAKEQKFYASKGYQLVAVEARAYPSYEGSKMVKDLPIISQQIAA